MHKSTPVLLFTICILTISSQTYALECANAGAAPTAAPNDTGDGNATACGNSATAAGDDSTALGTGASAAGGFSTALGRNAAATGLSSIAVGPVSNAGGNSSSALGDSATSAGFVSTAIGSFSSAAGDESIALGRSASASAIYSTALGKDAAAAGISSVALGEGAAAGGFRGIAMGRDALAPTDRAIAIGPLSISEGIGSTAVGSTATAIAYFSLAAGDDAFASGFRSTALGGATEATGSSSVALGAFAESAGSSSVAIGFSTLSSGDSSTAIGDRAQANGEDSTAIGYRASAPINNTVVLGQIEGLNGASDYANIAIGTSNPLGPLHIFRADETREMLIIESDESGGPQDRALMDLSNNGGIRFQFSNNSLGAAWRFQAATGNKDRFEITRVGTGLIEFSVDDLGNAFVAGDLDVGGSLLTNLLLPSDANTKKNFKPIDPEAILARVTALPVTSWEYAETPGNRHIGPIAQDFSEAFGFGNSSESIAVVDALGVALASIQALNKKLERQNAALRDRDRALDQARQDQDKLESRLARLERLVEGDFGMLATLNDH